MNIRKKTNFLLFFILVGAFVVRVWGINFGLPYKHFIDEQHLIYWAFYSGSHSLRPVYYLYAPLIPTLLLVEFSTYYIGGYLVGVFSTPPQFFIRYLSDPTIFFLIGRVTMAILGVATVWLIFVVGKTFFNGRIGLLAALFLAFTFLHVKESHYIKQDVLLTFFVLASFYFALNMLQKERIRDYLFCGFMFGFAMGAKYQAILILPVIVLVYILSTLSLRVPSLSRDAAIPSRLFRRFAPRNDRKRLYRQFLSKLAIFAASSFFTFALIHPYFIIEPKETLERTLPFAVSNVSLIYSEHLQDKPVWWWFTFVHLPQGMGIPLFVSALLGFAVALLKRKSHFLLVPLFPIIFFATIDIWSKLHFARYGVMTLPFFALGGAIFLDYAGDKIQNQKRRNILLIALAIVIMIPSFLRTIQFDTLITKPDTRIIAERWFESTIPAGSKILVESTLKPEYPSNLNVPLNLDERSINKRIQEAEQRGLKASYLKSLLRANKNKIGYEVIATTQVGAKMNIFTDELTRIKDVSYYVDNGVEYIVLTGWVQEKMSKEFAKSLYEHYQLIKEFRPTYAFNTDPHLMRVEYEMLDKVDIFHKDIVFGPTITVYRLKDNL